MKLNPINLSAPQAGTNEGIPMTRRYPSLPAKVLKRDSKIAMKLIQAWDYERNGDKALNIFLKEQKNLSHFRYWELLRTVWTLAGSTKRVPLFLPLLTSKRPERHYFSTPEEQKRLRELPEVLTVFRAQDEEDGGISWTLSKEYAQVFQRLFNKDTIVEKTIQRNEIYALIERNGEEEILLLPE